MRRRWVAPGASAAAAKTATETDPSLLGALLDLVEPTRRGDPCSALCWTTLSTRNRAGELARSGHRVSADTVARLLHEQGFSLQGNAKIVEGGQHLDRDAQFSYLKDQVSEHLAAADPVISVDTKKKELVGQYTNAGQEWHPQGQPEPVKVHDFIDPELGKANPYGVYDLAADSGWVSVGTDHDTAAFAVETIRRWWQSVGINSYPNASRLLITADGGGSNGYRTRLWKNRARRSGCPSSGSYLVRRTSGRVGAPNPPRTSEARLPGKSGPTRFVRFATSSSSARGSSVAGR